MELGNPNSAKWGRLPSAIALATSLIGAPAARQQLVAR